MTDFSKCLLVNLIGGQTCSAKTLCLSAEKAGEKFFFAVGRWSVKGQLKCSDDAIVRQCIGGIECAACEGLRLLNNKVVIQ